jgi:gliding motility-associated protein GldM
MSGEKLSARQKMIGMMYLVLTALLALQVSSSVLDKFVLINKSLEKSIQTQETENNLRLEQIKSIVEETGSRAKDVELLNQALSIRKETTKVTAYIDKLKEELIEKTGGKDAKTGRPKGVKNDGTVAKIMINDKRADELKGILNGYMQYLTKMMGKEYKPIALDAKDSDLFKNDPNQHDKKFAVLNFEKTPLGAVLATLTQFGTDIIYAEADALDTLAGKLGAGDVKFDNIFPLVKPQSNIVAAGSTYDAELLVAASSSAIEPEMTIDGRKIPVNAGIGKINFVATPGNYDQNGLAKKVFKAAIKLRVPGGESVITKDIEYFVAKPVIQVQSAAVSALYLNAGNELMIQVPALGINYNPTFKAEGATVVPGQGKGLVTLIPNAKEVKLSVYNSGNLLDTISFKVRTIPRPEIQVTSGGKPINERQGVVAPGPRKIEVKVIPDESFLSFLPKDARYRVAEWEVTLARGSRSIQTKRLSNQQEVTLNDFAALAQSGDRIVVDVKKVERLNYKNEIETVNLGTAIHNIPIN